MAAAGCQMWLGSDDIRQEFGKGAAPLPGLMLAREGAQGFQEFVAFRAAHHMQTSTIVDSFKRWRRRRWKLRHPN